MLPHDLHHEFPEFHERIHALKVNNHHFRRLFDEYHTLNRDIERMETEGNFSEIVLENAKKQRLALKDELYAMLKAA